ncbi:uncharacterized protein LOC110859370 [Folsomia candida]|uniref:uncharacterized protein LOC110859370 n=1 Tax=Folsomia candida TaxID=158441 RepID=UPI001604C9B5|nr:uncharacterized protein LOC110859370 [Folsomia candida]
MDHLVSKLTYVHLALWIAVVVSESLGLSSVQPQNVDLYFPTPIAEGDDLTMNCRFKVDQNSSIYQVKWYKGNREIFRYTQKESPPKKSFPLSHVIVDEKQSDMNKLVLRKVPLALRGVISCEVSFEPSFQTIIKTSQLLVVSKPKTRPSLTVEFYPLNKPNSKTGVETVMVKKDDVLTANCTAGPSIPSPNITFFINGENYNSIKLGVLERKQEVTVDPVNKTEIRWASLRLQISYAHFVAHKIRVRCEATLFNLYNETSDQYEAERFRETVMLPSSYGGVYGKNGAGWSMGCGGGKSPVIFGRLVWSIAIVGAVQLVLLLTTLSNTTP